MGQNPAETFAALRDSEFEWDERDALRFDDQYRRRQLPLLRPDRRPDFGPAQLGPGEYWPAISAVAIPLIDPPLHRTGPLVAFLDDLRRSSIADTVWWEGLAARADRMHATLLVPAESGDRSLARVAAQSPPLRLRVRGPWVGRYNRGRIYLPVVAADAATERTLSRLWRALLLEPRPLLAGFVQLTAGLTGSRYAELRNLIRAHQRAVDVPVSVRELWRLDAMDDLVLRSAVAGRFEFSGRATAPAT